MHLYERLLGASFDALPKTMRTFHRHSHATATAQFSVRRAPGWFAAFAAALFRLPRPGSDVPVFLEVTAAGDTERWGRRFGSARFDTRQSIRAGKLCERSGPFAIVFDVRGVETGMSFRSERCAMFGVPLPHWMAPSIEAWTAANENGWSMEVCVSVPRFGWVERYGGDVVPAP